MFSRVIKFLWGDLTKEEYIKFGLLASVYMMIIGCYAIMDALKYAFFLKTVGRVYMPYAKILSLFLILPMILVYSKLVDIFSKDKLFYFFSGLYIVAFLIFNFLFALPKLGLANTITSPTRYLGWCFFVVVESYTSFMVSLFLSFVVSSSSTESAKKGFALVAAGAQTGAVLGPTLVSYASTIGVFNLLKISCLVIFVAAVLIKVFMIVCKNEKHNEAFDTYPKKAGVLEGLKILLSRPYVFVIFVSLSLYSIIGTLLDYQLKFLADGIYQQPEKLIEFFGLYGQCTNGLSLVFAIFGTSFLVRRLGLTFCLVLFPLLTAAILLFTYINPVFWAIVLGASLFRALSYGFNNPNREILYIPTSRSVKFKAKSWIDVFGIRLSKAAGSGLNAFFAYSGILLSGGAIASISMAFLWIPLMFWLAKTNQKLVKENKIIE